VKGKKMKAVKAWVVLGKAGDMYPFEYSDGHLDIYKTKHHAKANRLNGERIARVLITEVTR
jgi:hypothetical protein